jgi:hypothetical protein
MAKAPIAPISPIGKLQLIKEEVADTEIRSSPKIDQSKSNKIVKDDAYWKNVNRIRSLLSQPIKRKNYNLSFLHTLDNVNDEFISCYERSIPLVNFDSNFSQLTFKKEDNRKLFERTVGNDEPQLLRLVHQKPTKSPMLLNLPANHNDALLADLFD